MLGKLSEAKEEEEEKLDFHVWIKSHLFSNLKGGINFHDRAELIPSLVLIEFIPR